MITKSQLNKVKNNKKPGKKKARKRPAKKAPAKKRATKKKAVRKKSAKNTTQRVDRELFAIELIKNSMNATAAYKAVCPNVTDKTAATNGHRVLREAETIDHLRPMLEKLFIDAGIEAQYVFKRWLEIAEGSASDYFNFDSGRPVLDMSDLTPAQKRNLKSISINHTQHGTNYKIETYDAQRAIDTIGKHLGLLVEKMAEEDVERIGDIIERGVARIRSNKDLDAWKDVVIDTGDYREI